MPVAVVLNKVSLTILISIRIIFAVTRKCGRLEGMEFSGIWRIVFLFLDSQGFGTDDYGKKMES